MILWKIYSFINIIRVKNFNEPRVSPNALHHSAVLSEELSEALDAIGMEITLENLFISELDSSSTFFCIFGKHSLVELPIIL